MATLPIELKRKIAHLYSEKKRKLEDLNPNTMESFASALIDMISKAKEMPLTHHDLEILDYNMKLLKSYAVKLKEYEPETDEYDFTRNDCKNLVDSTKKWLKLEGLL